MIKTAIVMKKLFVILAVSAIFVVLSCSKEQHQADTPVGPETPEAQGVKEFSAALPETKTYLGAPSGDSGARTWPTYWKAGDFINVNGVSSSSITIGGEGKTASYAVFTMAGEISTVGGYYHSIYPASAVSNWNSSAKSATITIPATQTYTAPENEVPQYDPSAYIMVGKSSTATLNFSPMMGLIQLTTTAPASGTLYIKSITVEPVGDEAMSGTFTTDYSVISGGTASSGITISAASGSTFAFGTVFTFAVPAQNYDSGVRFRITAVPNDDGTGDEVVAVFSKQSAFDVAAGTIYPLTAPAFKEAGVTISNIFSLTSSSIQLRWNGANVSNNKSKSWRIHAYTNSACTSEFGSGWTIPNSASSCWDADNSYLTFVVGGLARNTTYWFKVEDVQNGVWSAASSSVTTQSFTQVSMPGSITSTGVVLAEDFNELAWGSTNCFRRSAGFRPASTTSFSNISTDGATFHRWDSEINFRDGILNTAFTSSRLNNWISEEYVYAKPGHLKLGTSSKSGWIITPEFPVPANKNAVVNVTVNAARYSKDEQTEYAIAVLRSGLIETKSGYREVATEFPDLSDTTLYQTVNYTSYNSWADGTAEGLVLTAGDRILFGRKSGGGNTKPRIYVNSIIVEVTAIENLPAVDYIIYDKATLKTFLTAASGASVTGRLASNITLTSDEESDLASVYPVANYSGTLYGLNHTISGLKKPLFDNLQGTVSKLTLNSALNITSDMTEIGIFAKSLSGMLDACTAKGSLTFDVSSSVSGEHRMGGLVGLINTSTATITDCTNEASVTNKTAGGSGELMVGGVVGTFWGTAFSISGCTNTGTVSNTGDWTDAVSVGGIIGQAGNSSGQDCELGVSDCINDGAVSNSGESTHNYVGGILGWVRYGRYSGNSNTGTVSNSGTSPDNYIGGLIGYVDQGATFDDNANSGDISNSGIATTSNVIGGILGYAGTSCTLGGHKFINNGDIENTGAAKNMFIGGLLGRNSSGYFNMTASGWGTASINNGDITESSDNSSKANGGDICIGGIVGYTTTGIKTQYARNYGTLYVTGQKGNTGINIGGIGGWIHKDNFNFNNCRNEGNITVDCTTTSGIWAAGIVGCPLPNSTLHYYWVCKATIDTHAATVSGNNYTAGFVGATEGSDASQTWNVYGWRFDGTVWGNKTTTGLLVCTKDAGSKFSFQGGSDHPTVIKNGSVRKDNSNNNTISSNSNLTIGVLAGGAGSSTDNVSTAISSVNLKVGAWW